MRLSPGCGAPSFDIAHLCNPSRLVKKTVIGFIWFVSFVWLNETNQTNQINQINKTNQIDQITRQTGILPDVQAIEVLLC